MGLSEGMATMTLDHALALVQAEVFRAHQIHGGFHSAHEGYAVILEELDELWEEVRRNPHDQVRMTREAVQVAAMAVQFLMSVT